MKRIVLLLVISLILLLGSASAGTFTSGSTGADGAFSPTTNTVLQVPPSGIFNYTTVNIPVNITVTFIPNAANTPVYMLATGNVTVAGYLNVNGVNTTDNVGGSGGAGGPGGYGGGCGLSGAGLGPGAGGGGSSTCSGWAAGGSFGTAGNSPTGGTNCPTSGAIYGNTELQPLVGGSGGGGGTSATAGGGGGGGGAILIASSGTITISNTGTIAANGGNQLGFYNGYGGGGSGGAIRLIANTISGNGTISASGGAQGSTPLQGGNGRIRLEAYTVTRTVGPVYMYAQPGAPFLTNAPALNIMSIGGVTVPANPKGSLATVDVWLPSTTTNPVNVSISAANIPVNTAITITVTPQQGAVSSTTAALSGTLSSSTASANVTLPNGGNFASVITAYATFTLQTAMYYEGEKVDKVRVASTLGGRSEAVYITETGREIKSDLLALSAFTNN